MKKLKKTAPVVAKIPLYEGEPASDCDRAIARALDLSDAAIKRGATFFEIERALFVFATALAERSLDSEQIHHVESQCDTAMLFGVIRLEVFEDGTFRGVLADAISRTRRARGAAVLLANFIRSRQNIADAFTETDDDSVTDSYMTGFFTRVSDTARKMLEELTEDLVRWYWTQEAIRRDVGIDAALNAFGASLAQAASKVA